ncbi:type II and III secretion system protein [Solidesulfovibrio sp.]|uniref:type II and III secretion system protein n=1 Tax=Solidesulfovibrio sp. TaxID=2910990 RepID=UPI000EBE2949|nr:type II and III secretion system protein [Desulfovibrio sp.]
MQGKRYGRAVIAALVVASLTAPGCVKKPPQDAFIRHWDTMANKSEGYTPTAHPRKIEKEQAAITTPKQVREEAKPVKRLPTQRVTLRMYDTDLVAVVRAMARAANQNVVLSSSIPGSANGGQGGLRINVNVADAPWDETFKSILVSNGLTYAIDGDIVRVMTLADMEQQNKLKEADNKLAAEAARAKSMEPYETWKVEVNFADLDELAVTLNSLCGNTTAMPGLGKGSLAETAKTTGGASPNDAARTTNIAVSDPVKGPTPALPALGDYKLGLLKGFVIPDHYSNSLVIQASNTDAEKIIQLIEKLDQPRPQIRLKAFIVQTDRSTAQQLGIQWGGMLKGTNFRLSPAQIATTSTTTTNGSNGSTNATVGTISNSGESGGLASNTVNGVSTLNNVSNPVFAGGTSGQGFGLNYPALSNSLATASGLGAAGTGINFLFGKIGENVLEAQLTALAEDNKVKILSSPTITTMENKEAYTENGKKIPYVSTSQNGTNVQFADALLRLEMLPHVIDGSNLRMKIVVKDDQVDENQSNWVQGNPPIYKRETRSTLVVEDGDTIVISGLTRDTVTDGQSGVPLLRDIPGLGWAFKSKSNSIKREQILIFVTPKILKEKPVAPVPPVADRVDPQALARGPVAAAEVVKP